MNTDQPSLEPPKISIVLPVLNGEKYILEAITNCLQQSVDSIEIIVVDGGSTDRTLEICRAVRDPRLYVHVQSNNSERLPGALNYGFSKASGRYLTWTHDDNLYAPNALEQMAAVLDASPEIGLVYTDYWLVKGDLTPIRRVCVGPAADLIYRNCIGPSFLYRTEASHAVGEYDPGTVLHEDYDYWIRMTRLYESKFISQPLYYYRVHEASLTGRYRRAMFDQFLSIRERAFPDRHLPKKRRALADWYIAWAFEDYYTQHYGRALRGFGNGIVRSPHYAANRGVVRLVLESLWRLVAPRS